MAEKGMNKQKSLAEKALQRRLQKQGKHNSTKMVTEQAESPRRSDQPAIIIRK